MQTCATVLIVCRVYFMYAMPRCAREPPQQKPLSVPTHVDVLLLLALWAHPLNATFGITSLLLATGPNS